MSFEIETFRDSEIGFGLGLRDLDGLEQRRNRSLIPSKIQRSFLPTFESVFQPRKTYWPIQALLQRSPGTICDSIPGNGKSHTLIGETSYQSDLSPPFRSSVNVIKGPP